MRTIYLTDDVKDRSYATTKTYEDNYTTIGLGKTGDYGSKVRCITVSLKVGDSYVYMVGGENIVKQWESTTSDAIPDFSWKLLIANITPEIFQDLILQTQLSGIATGKSQALREIQKALGLN